MRPTTRAGIAALSACSLLVPAASAWAGALGQAAHRPATTPTRTFTGPSVDMRWGPVQVRLLVRGQKILDVRTSYPTERARSQHINDIAVPMLREQVLKQQGIKGVYMISGATMTSEAYGQSLQAALDQAHITR